MDKIMQEKYDNIIYHANRIMLNGPQHLIDLIDDFINDEENRYALLLDKVECKIIKFIDLLNTENINSKKIVKDELVRYLKMIKEDKNQKGGN